MPEESKRDYLQRVLERLSLSGAGKAMVLQLARFLAEQTVFPDLQGWEDPAEKLDAANRSVTTLKSYLNEQELSISSEEQRQESRLRLREAQAKARASQQTLQSLSDKLAELSSDIGTAETGLDLNLGSMS